MLYLQGRGVGAAVAMAVVAGTLYWCRPALPAKAVVA